MKRLIVGYEAAISPVLSDSIAELKQIGYDYCITPLVHPRLQIPDAKTGAFTRTDTILSNSDWTSFIIGKISEHWNVDIGINEDGTIEAVKECNTMMLQREMWLGCHLPIVGCLVTLPLYSPCYNFNRELASFLKNPMIDYKILIKVPMKAPNIITNSYRRTGRTAVMDTWNLWNEFVSSLAPTLRVCVALEISEDIIDRRELNRWFGEPIHCVILHTRIFTTNKSGFPILTKGHQELLHEFFKRDIHVVVTGRNRHKHLSNYVQYLHYLFEMKKNVDPIALFAEQCKDSLQIPLQPLKDNLCSDIYETFEKDKIKYTRYQEAVLAAITDKLKYGARNIVVMVVGAGRGPIVNSCLIAAREANTKIKLYAIEKNPYAIHTLLARKRGEWMNSVEVIATDMRTWQAPEKADIIVSELLGSFGDNELSPECLSGAQRFLKDGGIMIPQNYTSFMCPSQNRYIFSKMAEMKEFNPEENRFELPAVLFSQKFFHAAPSKAVFTFHHPVAGIKWNYNQCKKLNFDIHQDCTIHGLSGFFETKLYGEVGLSIKPETYTQGMFSWFPIFFAIGEHPLPLKKGDNLELIFKRLNNGKLVWYEWQITKPIITRVFNLDGKYFKMHL